MNDTILITGGTGKIGRRIAELLRGQGVAARPVSRSTTPPFDWSDPTTWRAVLEGVRSVYLTSADVDQGPVEFVSDAAQAGVERIVLLSARGISTPGYFDEQDTLAAPFLRLEDAIVRSGMRWSILRPGWFMQNFSEGDFLADIRAGRLQLPVEDGAATWVDAADIAEVAATLLTDGGFEGEVLELGGPEGLTVAQAVAIISRQSGSDVTYEPIPEDSYRERLRARGLDEESIIVAAAGLSAIRRGHESTLVHGVQRVLRREPTSFETFARRERAAWREGLAASP